MNIKIKNTNQITKIWRNLLKLILAKSVILTSISCFCDLGLDLLKVILDILSLFFNNVAPCNIFLKEKANYNLKKEIA